MSKELKWLESKGVKNIILGISCDKGVVELSVLLKAYADEEKIKLLEEMKHPFNSDRTNRRIERKIKQLKKLEK